MTFDQAMDKLEGILNNLETNRETMNPDEVEEQLNEAEELRNYCKELLKQEKEELIRTAKDNGISPEEIGLFEDDEDESEYEYSSDEDDEEEESEDNEDNI